MVKDRGKPVFSASTGGQPSEAASEIEARCVASQVEGTALGLIWVFAAVAGDRKRSLQINGPQ